MEDKNRQKAIELALASIEKEYGKGSIMRLKDGVLNADVGVIQTGSIGLDLALGIGGYPKGRIIESDSEDGENDGGAGAKRVAVAPAAAAPAAAAAAAPADDEGGGFDDFLGAE